MNKLLILILLLSVTSVASEPLPAEKARGFFVSVGVGPRLPIFGFANSSDIGYGINVEFAYTDNEYLPFFLFGRIGFETFPGSQSFYQSTQYSNLSTNILPLHAGVRYYFPPLLENVVLLIPIVEISAAYTYTQKLHEFKTGSNRNNFLEDISKFGFSVGGGFSMFLMEIAANYNYFPGSQSVSVDLRVRLPLFITY